MFLVDMDKPSAMTNVQLIPLLSINNQQSTTIVYDETKATMNNNSDSIQTIGTTATKVYVSLTTIALHPSLSFIIIIVSCIVIVALIAAFVCWFRYKMAKHRKTHSSTKSIGVYSIPVASKRLNATGYTNSRNNKNTTSAYDLMHSGRNKMLNSNSHFRQNTRNPLMFYRSSDDANGYINPETVPKSSLQLHGYEVPMKDASGIQELNGYVQMQQFKTSPFPSGSYIELNSSTKNSHAGIDSLYASIPGNGKHNMDVSAEENSKVTTVA